MTDQEMEILLEGELKSIKTTFTKKVNGKKKGNRVELDLSKILSERFNRTFKRVPMSGAFGTFNRNSNLREDAMEILSGDIICPENFKFSIECKGRKDFNFWDLLNEDTKNLEINEWIFQVENDALNSKKEPLLYIKVNNKKAFVLFPKKIFKSKVTYGNYSILRFDYFLKFDDSFFFI